MTARSMELAVRISRMVNESVKQPGDTDEFLADASEALVSSLACLIVHGGNADRTAMHLLKSVHHHMLDHYIDRLLAEVKQERKEQPAGHA